MHRVVNCATGDLNGLLGKIATFSGYILRRLLVCKFDFLSPAAAAKAERLLCRGA